MTFQKRCFALLNVTLLLFTSQAQARHRSLFNWDAGRTVLGAGPAPTGQAFFFDFCQAKDIRRVYLAVERFTIQANRAAFVSFLQGARARDIEIWVHDGDNSDLPNNNGPSELYANANYIKSWNTGGVSGVPSDARFDGFMHDMEFHESGPGAPFHDGLSDGQLTATQLSQRRGLLRGYLDTIQGLRAILAPAGIPLGGAITTWQDSYGPQGTPMQVDWPQGGTLKPLYQYSMPMHELTLLMAYSTSPASAISRSSTEVAYAATIGRRVEVGQEVHSGLPASVSWWGQPEASFNSAVRQIVTNFRSNCFFDGVMVHDYIWKGDGYSAFTNYENLWTAPGSQPDGDGDADGMLNHWEISNGLDPAYAPDANGDPDGDGLSNLSEFNNDFNPFCPNALSGTATASPTPFSGAGNGAWPVLSNFDGDVILNNAAGTNTAANDNQDGCGTSASSASASQAVASPQDGTAYLRLDYNVAANAGCTYQYAAYDMPLVINRDLTAYTGVEFWVKTAGPAANFKVVLKSGPVDTCVAGGGGVNKATASAAGTGSWTLVRLAFSSFGQGSCPFFSAGHLSATASVSFVFDQAGQAGSLMLEKVGFYYDPSSPTPTPTSTPSANGSWPLLTNFNGDLVSNNAGGSPSNPNLAIDDNDDGCGSSASTSSLSRPLSGSWDNSAYGRFDFSVAANAGCGYQYAAFVLPLSPARSLSAFSGVSFYVRGGTAGLPVKIELKSAMTCPSGKKNKVTATVPVGTGWSLVQIPFSAFNSGLAGCDFWAGGYLNAVESLSFSVEPAAPPLSSWLGFDDLGFYGSSPQSPTRTPTPATASRTPTPQASPSRTLTRTPTATPSLTASASPTATVTFSPSASPSRTASSSATATPSVSPPPSPSATRTVSPGASPSMTRTASPSASPTRTASPSVTPTYTASPTSSPTASPTSSPTASATPSGTWTETPTPSSTPSATPPYSRTPSSTATPYAGTPTSTFTYPPSPTRSATPSASPSRTSTPTATPSSTATPSATPTHTLSSSPTATATASATGSRMPSATGSPSPSPSASTTASGTRTATASRTPSATASRSPSPTRTLTVPLTSSMTPTATPSWTRTATASSTPAASFTATRSATPSASPSPTPSASPSLAASLSPSATPTRSPAGPPEPTRSATPSQSPTSTPTRTPAPLGTPPGPSGPAAIEALSAVPNPWPKAFLVKLSAPGHGVLLRIYSAGYTCVALSNSGPRPAGWSALDWPAQMGSLPGGLYYARAQLLGADGAPQAAYAVAKVYVQN